MDDFIYPRPRSIRPKIILASGCVRFVVFDWKTTFIGRARRIGARRAMPASTSSLRQALKDVELLKQRLRWPPPDSWN